jgi:DnaJ-domain-containing protein 1
MPFNKDIITRIIVGFILFIAFAKVVGPAIFEILKNKLPGGSSPENDLDAMIRRQKERLRAEYGLTDKTNVPDPVASSSPAPSKEIETLYKETRWGGGGFAKDIQNIITKNYSYTLAESKVNAFLLLAEKRNYLKFLSGDHQNSPESIKNYLSLVMLLLLLLEEIRSKEFNLMERVAKKCQASTMELTLALQLKILFTLNSKKEIKEERLFESTPSLHQYSEDSMKEAIEMILKKEANLWTKGHSVFFEELALYLSYADILIPPLKIQHKKDTDMAYKILNISPEAETDEVKRVYKKLAMAGHPDKIGAMKLPKTLEKKALAKFNAVQEAYDLIMTARKK